MNINIDSGGEFTTIDFNLACIISLKYPIKEIRNDQGRGVFVFDYIPELDQFVSDYWSKKLLVEPISLTNTMKTTKQRLYNEIINKKEI